MSSTVSQAADAEHDRQERINELVQENGPNWCENFQPGSFGCHELLDRALAAAELVERLVLSHPACAQNPAWYALADQAVSSLNDLYQQIGAEHLSVEQRG